MPKNRVSVMVDGYLLVTINDKEHEVVYRVSLYEPEDAMGGNESVEMVKPRTMSPVDWRRIKNRLEEDVKVDAHRIISDEGMPLPDPQQNPHPFHPQIPGMDDTSYKIKVIATAMNTTTTEAARQIVDSVIASLDAGELATAMQKLGPPRHLSLPAPDMSNWIKPPKF